MGVPHIVKFISIGPGGTAEVEPPLPQCSLKFILMVPADWRTYISFTHSMFE
jgi:hypothetical protein